MAILGATSLTGCNSIPDFIAAGSRMLFEQSTAPTSWTKDATSHNNKALRVVTGTAAPGGSTAFTTVFASRTPTGSVSGSNSGGGVSAHTLSTAQIPSHTHDYTIRQGPSPAGLGGGNVAAANTAATTGTGGGQSHTHGFTNPTWSGSFSGSALDFAVQYVDLIIASKNV
jgi:hypothetical protein